MQSKIPFEFLQGLMQQSAHAAQAFDHFLGAAPPLPPEEAKVQIQLSLEAFLMCVSQLQQPPLSRLPQTALRKFLNQSETWFAGRSPEDMATELIKQSEEPWAVYFKRITPYLKLLSRLKVLAHDLVLKNVKDLPDAQSRIELHQLHPYSSWLQNYGISGSNPAPFLYRHCMNFLLTQTVRYGNRKWRTIVEGVAILLLLSFLGILGYLFLPYSADGVLYVYAGRNPKPPNFEFMDFFKNAPMHFEVPANGTPQTVTIPLVSNRSVNQILFSLKLRPERSVELHQVQLLGASGELIHELDWKQMHPEGWTLSNAIWSGIYQVQLHSIEELKAVSADRQRLARLAMERNNEGYNLVNFPPEFFDKLSTLLDQRFPNKQAITKALETLDGNLHREERKMVRMFSRVPVFRQKGTVGGPLWLSPILERPFYSDARLLLENMPAATIAAILQKSDIDTALAHRDDESLQRWRRQLGDQYPSTQLVIQKAFAQIKGIHTIRLVMTIYGPQF